MNENFWKLREILLKLFEYRLWAVNSLVKKHEKTIHIFPPMNRQQVEYLLSDRSKNPKSDFFSLDKPAFFYLPPLEKNSEFAPILILRCDYNESPPETRLMILMIRHIGDEEKCFGFRFEGPAIDSMHDYWHAQITTELRRRGGRQKLPGCPDWIPDEVPCIPTTAKCPVSLILCMLISLYGKRIFNEFFADLNIDPKYKKPLEPILRNQHNGTL